MAQYYLLGLGSTVVARARSRHRPSRRIRACQPWPLFSPEALVRVHYCFHCKSYILQPNINIVTGSALSFRTPKLATVVIRVLSAYDIFR